MLIDNEFDTRQILKAINNNFDELNGKINLLNINNNRDFQLQLFDILSKNFTDIKKSITLLEECNRFLLANTILINNKLEQYNNLEIGSTIRLGRYFIDNESKISEIEWIVLEFEANRMLLISKLGLDAMCFDENHNDWKTSSIRNWLNKDFYRTAFSMHEKRRIITTKLENDCFDKLFLMSLSEVNKYFYNDRERICKHSNFAKSHGAYSDNGNSYWWLRSSAKTKREVLGITHEGCVHKTGAGCFDKHNVVRPAMWIYLDI